MKKIFFKKAFLTSAASLLVVSLVLSFTSCGKGKDKENTVKQEIPEYVYEASFNELAVSGVDYIEQSCINEGSIYMTGSHNVYNEKNEIEGSKSYLMSCPVDGSKISMTEMKGLKENEYINKLFSDEQSNMYVLTSRYEFNNKTGISENNFYMLKVDEKGKFSNRIKLKPDNKKNSEFYLGGNVIYIKEKLLVVSDGKIYIFNKDGSEEKTVKYENYVSGMFTANSGKVYIIAFINGTGSISICELNIENGSIGAPIDLGGNAIYEVNYVKQLEDGKVYLSDYDRMYECDFESGKMEALFDWINVDIDGGDVSDFHLMEDGSVVVLSGLVNYSESDSVSDIEVATISKKKYSETKQKKKLVLATDFLDENVKKEILKFNKTNEDCHIEVKNYGSVSGGAGEQMNLDIISGNVPDIVDLSFLPKDLYIKKGLFTDLSDFMDKDDEVKKEDFIDSVRTTVERDGKLYYMPVSFDINGITCSKEVFGDMEGWTLEELEETYKNIPKDGVLMYGATSEWFVENMLNSHMNDFINFETGEVKLDSDEFIHIIEFSKNFKTTDEYMSEMNSTEDILASVEGEYEDIRNGNILLNEVYIEDFFEIQAYNKLYSGLGGYNIISYPSPDKNNKLAMSTDDSCFAISEKCVDKEGAWEFLRRLYTYEFQKTAFRENGIPVRKDALEKKIEYATATKAYKDDNGTIIEPINNMNYSLQGFLISIKPFTEEDMDLFRSIIDRIGIESNTNTVFEDIVEIVNDEMKAFLKGDKTAKETAEVLQSKVKIYVSENS